MARVGSVALGGFYKTPESVLPELAKLLSASANYVSYLDPCAGEGEAVLQLSSLVHPKGASVSFFTVELETSRYATLKKGVSDRDYKSGQFCLQGDAFRATFRKEGANIGLLYLNPPYDTDPVHGRLEEKFLSRFAPTLGEGGVLVFLVPFYALKASAETLAKCFDTIACFRFPETEFGAYKQVALFAKKRATDLWQANPVLEEQILAWAANADSIPEFPSENGPVYTIPSMTYYVEPLSSWSMQRVDFKSLVQAVSPWSQTDKGGKSHPIQGILPEGTIEDLLTREYPLAMPPRPAHIAAGIAAGIFNGAKISPDKEGSPLPSLLVKGVFDKEFRTVEEKTDKDGNVKGLVQVQQPKLVTTVLDLSSSEYVTIKASTDITNTTEVANMTMADLLASYGEGLMDVMLQQCPVLHNPKRPEDAIELPKLERPLYEAQKHAVMGAVKLLGGLDARPRERKYKSAFVLGEIGSGKSSVALATAEAIKAKRVLILCPPHLLTSWGDQIKAVTPWYRTIVLTDIAEVQKLADLNDDVPTVAILSRETAKLGHAYGPVTRCGKCGAKPPKGVDTVKKRARCENRPIVVKNAMGRATMRLAQDLLSYFPHAPELHQIVRGPLQERAANKEESANPLEAMLAWDSIQERGSVDALLGSLLRCEPNEALLRTLACVLLSDRNDERILRAVKSLFGRGFGEAWSVPVYITFAKAILSLVTPEKAAEVIPEYLAQEIEARKGKTHYGQSVEWEWKQLEAIQKHVWGDGPESYAFHPYTISKKADGVYFDKKLVGDKKLILQAIQTASASSITNNVECGEPLFQAIPEPRRYPLATYIAKRYPNLFDLLVADEAHEYATDGSAQERSAHRLMSLGIPTLMLTGTVMNGYAESLFTNVWYASADFRREFDRDERSRFVERFGYRKRLIEDKDKNTGKVVEYGSMTDRVERHERMIGDAPGVLPLFLLKYLLRMSVTLHKTDLKIDIPKCTENVDSVTLTSELSKNLETLQSALISQIKADRFLPDLAGKLWGAMAELPSYLDLATSDVGNTEKGDYEIRYPDSCGNGLVATIKGLDPSIILPKEEWLLAEVEKSLAAGRNVMVFAWHTKLLPRLSRLIEERTGKKAPILNPAKVPTAKRETWINTEIIKKKHRVLVVNPVTVQTGLNNLVYFADQIWMENPACNPVTYRQAVGRVDRIGQKLPTNIIFPLYRGTPQEALHSLLLQKVAVSLQTDGLDAESALQAAGVGDEGGFNTFAVGRQLYELLTREVEYRAA